MKFVNYADYQRTHGQALRQKFIYGNKHAHCAITGERYRNRLCFHHFDYSHLYHERLHRDGEVVDVRIHEQLNFIRVLGIRIKLPCKPLVLRKRYYYVKTWYALREKNYRKAFYSLSELAFK